MDDRNDHSPQRGAGLAYGLLAYAWWGLVPIYFKWVAHVPPLAVLAHRVVWSVVFLVAIVAAQRRWGELRDVTRSRRLMLTLTGSTIAVALNWLFFIHAISSNRVLQASLGYFINPLLTVGLAIVFLKERLRATQALALSIAAAGVIVMAWRTGQMPWLALGMALTFGLYGLLRKVAPVGPLVGLTVETTLLLPLGLAFAIAQLVDDSDNRQAVMRTYPLLMLAGVVTAIPLLSFAAAARRLRLMTLGFLQYVGPTLQFLLAVLVYGERFTTIHAISFGLIWLALAVYSIDSLRAFRARTPASNAIEAPA